MEEVSAKRAPLPNIPVEIIRHILLELPVRSLIRFQCVCKEWCSIIQDPDFKLSYRGQRRVVVVASEGSGSKNLTFRSITNNLHLENTYKFREHFPFLNTQNQVYEHSWPPRVWCSCNGLVLFNVKDHILLWNPSIRCCTKVLELRELRDPVYAVVSGLCYDSSTGDYKAVILLHHFSADIGNGGRFVIVASLRNKKWQQVRFPYNLFSARAGIEFHHTLHWMASDIKRERRDTDEYHYGYDSDDSRDWEWDNHSGYNKVVYFDWECDEFRDLPTPEASVRGEEDSIIGLGIIGDCVCMGRRVKEMEMIEVLVMEKYKVKESWVSKFVFPILYFRDHFLAANLNILENITKILIWSRGMMCVYDLNTNKSENFLEKSKYGSHFAICFHVESFASPHGFVWRDDEHNTVHGRQFADGSLGGSRFYY